MGKPLPCFVGTGFSHQTVSLEFMVQLLDNGASVSESRADY